MVPAMTSENSLEQQGAYLQPLDEEINSGKFPAPRDILTELLTRLQEQYSQAIKGRHVSRPEDTHPTIRQFNHYRTQLLEYSKAFKKAADEINEYMELELIEAVGANSQGVPSKSMEVPHDGTVIKLAPEFKIDRDIEMDQVIQALAALLATEFGIDPESPSVPTEAATQLAVEVAHQALSLYRKSPPSIKAVQALAAFAGHKGDDTLASIIRSAIGKTRYTYTNRVKVDNQPA